VIDSSNDDTADIATKWAEKLGLNLKLIREGERKLGVLRKTVKRITELARNLKAKVVIGKFSSKAKEGVEDDKDPRLRHGIHQWSVVKFVEMLKAQPIDVVELSEAYTSSVNPFNGEG